MSRIKLLLIGLWVLVFTNQSAFGQTRIPRPDGCVTAPTGYTLGGDFIVSQWSCFDGVVTPSARVLAGNTTGVNAVLGYQFDYKGGAFNIGAATVKDNFYTQEGFYWVVQVGTDAGGNKLVSCKEVEIIKTSVPEIESNTCGPLSASVKILNTPNNQKQGEYVIDWGDGSPLERFQAPPYDVVRTKTYATANPLIQPKIVGYYRRANVNVCSSLSKDFLIGTSAGPKITELKGLNGGTEAKITMVNGNENQDYTLQYKARTAATYVDTPNKLKRAVGAVNADATMTGLTKNTEYCFRVQRIDPSCSIPAVSNEICSINITPTVESFSTVKLDWNVPASPNVVDLRKYSVRLTDQSATTYPGYDRTVNNFTYDLLECGKKYKFYVTATYRTSAGDNITVISPEVDVEPNVATLPPKTVGTVSVANPNEILVNIYEGGKKEEKYIFYRAEGGGDNYLKVKETPDNRYTDIAVEPEKTQYCYKVSYLDACKNESPLSPAFCNVYLTSKQANTLNWTPFVIPDPNNTAVNGQEIKYVIELFDANGNVTSQPFTTKELTQNVYDVLLDALDRPDAKGKVTFRIQALQKAIILDKGVLTPVSFPVYSNTYTFITPAQLFVPNAFTPNGDGPNESEIFKAYGRFIADFTMIIYDRWGKPIYESLNIADGWNGMEVDGSTPAPPGNYAYKIYGKDTAGQSFEKLGVVTLLK